MSFFSTPIEANASLASTGGTYDPLPEGEYDLLIEQSEEKPSSKGDPMLRLKLKVEVGEYAGRFLFENVVLAHANPKAVEIGQRKLHGLMILSGVKKLTDASDFLGRSFRAKVRVVNGTDKNGKDQLQNEVRYDIPKSAADTSAAGGSAGVKPPSAGGPAKSKAAESDW